MTATQRRTLTAADTSLSTSVPDDDAVVPDLQGATTRPVVSHSSTALTKTT